MKKRYVRNRKPMLGETSTIHAFIPNASVE